MASQTGSDLDPVLRESIQELRLGLTADLNSSGDHKSTANGG
jgi:hypothetical protein